MPDKKPVKRPHSARGAVKKIEKNKAKKQSVLDQMPGYGKKKYDGFGNEIGP